MKLKLDNTSDIKVDLDEVFQTQEELMAQSRASYSQFHHYLRRKTGNPSGYFQRATPQERQTLDQLSQTMIYPYEGNSMPSLLKKVHQYVRENPDTELSISEIATLIFKQEKKYIESALGSLKKQSDALRERNKAASPQAVNYDLHYRFREQMHKYLQRFRYLDEQALGDFKKYLARLGEIKLVPQNTPSLSSSPC